MTRKKGSRSNGYYLPVSLDQLYRQPNPPRPPYHPPGPGGYHPPGPGYHPPGPGYHPPGPGYHPPGPGYHPPGPGYHPPGVGMPPGPPPQYIPQPQQAQGYQHGPGGGVGGVYHDPHGIRFCLHRYVYIWPSSGRPFWAYPTQMGWNMVSGYRWRQRFGRWEPFSLPLNLIANYQCT